MGYEKDKEVKMDTFLFKDKNTEQFELFRQSRKIIFEYRVNTENKDRFLQFVTILSSIEFMVDVNLDDMWIREYADNTLFRIKISGKERDINRWNDNLCCVSRSLRDNYDITYFKNREKACV